MKKIFIYYLPVCDKRSLDANRIKMYFSLNGYTIVKKPKDADIIIFITCAAFDSTAEASLRLIKRFQKYDAELIVSGCLPAIEKEKLEKIFHGRVIATKDLDDLDKLFPEHKIKFKEVEDANIPFDNINLGTLEGSIKFMLSKLNTLKKYIIKKISGKNSLLQEVLLESINDETYYIRIAWGCTGNCSYCVIKKAIGPIKSKPLEECLREFNEGLKQGYKRFLLTADETGSYGIDINTNLIELLDRITTVSGEYSIILRALRPGWAIKYEEELIEILKRNKIKRFEIPIQSGSDRILKLMHRFSDSDKIRDAILKFKKASDGLIVYTHMIIGFPSETWEDFEKSLSLIKEADIDAGLIFPFSCRKGSEAENIEPKISKKEILRRFRYARRYLIKQNYYVIYLRKPPLFLFVKNKK